MLFSVIQRESWFVFCEVKINRYKQIFNWNCYYVFGWIIIHKKIHLHDGIININIDEHKWHDIYIDEQWTIKTVALYKSPIINTHHFNIKLDEIPFNCNVCRYVKTHFNINLLEGNPVSRSTKINNQQQD